MTEDDDVVGSVAEEAAKLFEALQGWAKDNGAAEGAGGLGATLSDVSEHIASGAKECSYCPLCRAIALVRQTSPQVRDHLADAATSLLHAGAAFLEGRSARGAGGAPGSGGADSDGADSDGAGGPGRSSGVERIDLEDGDVAWDAD